MLSGITKKYEFNVGWIPMNPDFSYLIPSAPAGIDFRIATSHYSKMMNCTVLSFYLYVYSINDIVGMG